MLINNVILARNVPADDSDCGNMNFSNSPSLILAAITGAGFALLAYKLERGAVLWCIGGIIAALCIASICLGLAHAAAVPYTHSEIQRKESTGISAAVMVLAIIAALLGLANRGRSLNSGH